jgi:D-alanyl-lipoteichoic acid acyltransferase DltB (MBOAT superfamily)
MTFAVFYWGFDQERLAFFIATTHPFSRMFIFFMGVCTGLVMLRATQKGQQGNMAAIICKHAYLCSIHSFSCSDVIVKLAVICRCTVLL